MLASVLAFMMLCSSMSIPAAAQESAETIAAWEYTAAASNALTEEDPAGASAGSGILYLEGASYNGQFSSQSLPATGWNDGAWYLANINAAEYQNLTFSAKMRSSNTGPRDFRLEYLPEGAQSWTAIEGSDVEITSTSLADKYTDFSLPAELAETSFSLRIRQVGTASVNGGTVASTGVSNINNIVIKGEKVSDPAEPGTDPAPNPNPEPEPEPVPEPVPDLSGGTGTRISELQDGDTFIMYNASNKMVVADTPSGARLSGVAAEASADDVLMAPEGAAVFSASAEGEYYTFTCGGMYLTSGATGNSLTLEESPGEYSLWALEKDEDTGAFMIRSVNASYNGRNNQYIEYYNGFTTYGYNEGGSKDIYLISFYRADENTDTGYTVETGTVFTAAQWAGNADYESAGASEQIRGDLFSANDMKDEDASYSVVVNGAAVQPYTKSTSSSTGSTSCYMGGTGLGSGSDDYIQLALSSAGYADMELSFRLRASNTGPGAFRLKYSTDGKAFQDFTAGSYSYRYTSYGSGGTSSEVNESGEIADGVAKTSYAPGEYINFTFDVPAGAENAETLFIRLVPEGNSAKGDKAPGSSGTLRMDSVVLSASPIISDDICSYVKADPVSGEASVGTSVTLSCDTQDAQIWYSVNGGEYRIYDENAKPVLDVMPADIRAYAAKEGLADSIKVIYTYVEGKVKTVKASPNGGAVLRGTEVTLQCDTPGAVILYSEDGGATWTEYKDKLTLSELPKTYQVKAVREGYEDSNVLNLSYTERTNEKYNIYFGQLHSHTSYSDGAGTADTAFQHASGVENLDFLAITDHSNSYDNADQANINDGSVSEEWKEGHELADQYTTDEFVALMGYEMTWSNGLGHMNTFNTEGFQSRTQTEFASYNTALQNYYAALKTAPEFVSQFNHPGTTFGDFSDFAHYDEETDKLITLIEVGNGEGAIGSSGYFPSYQYYQRALDKGWHVAPTNNQDNHKGLWGDANTARSVVLADSLTRENIYDAMRNYRVYATEDNDLSIYYTLDGYEMGSILAEGQTGETVSLTAELKDPTDASIGTVQVITNGGLVLEEQSVSGNEATVEFTVDNNYSFYYLKIVETDGDIAVTAPVWVGEVEAAGINSFSTDEVLPVRGEALTATLELYNNEQESMTVDSIQFKVDGEVVHTADLSAAGLTEIPAMGTGTYSFDYAYDRAGNMEITAVVNASLNGAEKIYESNLKLTWVIPEMVTQVIIDGTHYNDYVTGYYGGRVGNITKIAGEQNIKVEVATEQITAETLEGCDLLVVSAPARRSGTDNAGDYTQSWFEDEFISAVKTYVENGGSVIVCGLADYQDKSQSDTDKHAAAQINKLLTAIGSTMSINDDEVYDPVNNGGQFYRLYPSVFNMDSRWTSGIVTQESDPENYQKYSQYSGCSVNPGEGEWLVKGFETTYSVDSDKDGIGSTDEIETDDDYGYNIVVPKGEVVFLASEDTAYGGTVFAAGGVFLSDFEVAAELDNIWDLPYANRTIAENILAAVKVELEPMTIAEFRSMEVGEVGTIEGYVTAGTSNENNKFFDAIYVQDDTAGITVFPYAETGLEIGTKVKITGYVDAYQGDKEIQIMNVEVQQDAEKKVYEPAELSAADAMNYEANGGRLVRVQGRVTRVVLDDTGNGVSQFWLDDGSGQEANIFIDGYITSGTTGKNELASFVKEGATVSAAGLVYAHPEGESDIPVTCLRVRNVDEIIPAEEAVGVEKEELRNEVLAVPSGTQDHYTAESWTAYQSAYQRALEVLADTNATDTDVAAALQALREAKAGLVENADQAGGGNGGTVSAGSGNTGDGSTKGNAGGSGSGNAEKAVSTGDETPIAAAIVLLLISAGVTAVLIVRRRNSR